MTKSKIYHHILLENGDLVFLWFYKPSKKQQEWKMNRYYPNEKNWKLIKECYD